MICETNQFNEKNTLHLFSLYKDWLRHYRRRSFDPFRRRERILFRSSSEESDWFQTTVAQLNFLKWAEEHGVIRYVREHIHAIEQDMMKTLSASKLRRNNLNTSKTTVRKRTELSKAPKSKCIVYDAPQTFTWPKQSKFIS